MRRFEFKDGSSNKFWEISLAGETYSVRYGRIGADGQSSSKAFSSPALALAAHDKLVAEKVKSGYVEIKAKAPKRAVSKSTVANSTSAKKPTEKAIVVRDQASFEAAFGPIKKLASANSRLRECRLPGPSYYNPTMNATPPMVTALLWTTGFHPKDVDGATIADWEALGEAVSIARELARTLKGVMITSDTDCDYYPFVLPKPFDGKAVAKHVYAGLGCQTKGPRDFEIERTKKPETFFWDADDEPEEYYSPGDVAKCRAAAAIFGTLDQLVKITMKESFITYPLLIGGVTKSGLLVGVMGIRVDT